MDVDINPKRVAGPWSDGYASDVHTTSSVFLGDNAYGHPEFATTRSPMGELLYRLKFCGDQSTVAPIVETVAAFLANWAIQVDAIVPIPPSNVSRKRQPVIKVAGAISARTGIPLCESCVCKIKSTAQLKNVFDRNKRDELLADAFGVDEQKTRAKRLLIFDDLYRSGATPSAIARLLTEQGGAAAVYLLTLTQTRKNL